MTSEQFTSAHWADPLPTTGMECAASVSQRILEATQAEDLDGTDSWTQQHHPLAISVPIVEAEDGKTPELRRYYVRAVYENGWDPTAARQWATSVVETYMPRDEFQRIDETWSYSVNGGRIATSPSNGIVLAGRGRGLDIRFTEPTVSLLHAIIVRAVHRETRDSWFVCFDLFSLHGSKLISTCSGLNQRLKQQEQVTLKGDRRVLASRRCKQGQPANSHTRVELVVGGKNKYVIHLEPREDSPACAVCFEQPRRVVFDPCGHFVVCWACADRLNQCPICRTPVSATNGCEAWDRAHTHIDPERVDVEFENDMTSTQQEDKNRPISEPAAKRPCLRSSNSE